MHVSFAMDICIDLLFKKKYLDRFFLKLKKSIPLISFVLIITQKGGFIINYISFFFFLCLYDHVYNFKLRLTRNWKI